MRNRVPRLEGRKVRLEPDGPLGVIVNKAHQSGHWVVAVQAEVDGTVEWAKWCDTIPADVGD